MKRLWLAFFLVLLVAGAADAAVSADDLCPICSQHYGTKIYAVTKKGSEEKVLVCADCAKLETECYICGVPVKDKLTKLADGRLLCETDARQAVLEPHDAAKLFDDVKRDAQTILARLGTLPHHNIQVVLEAKARLDKTGANVISTHDDSLLMGLTRSTRDGDNFQHRIYLLHGLTRERMVMVAAHEYGHAWLHENVHRKLNRDAIEGFCDWLAFKVIQSRLLSGETKVLLQSDYSAGQLQAFLAAETAHNFYRVMQWVKHGTDPEIDVQRLERILELRESPDADPAPAFAFAPTALRPPAPTNLVLKGLSGSKARRFALINDGTFGLNEQGKVRLGTSNVVLRCLEIHDGAVVIQVAGESTSRTLTLNSHSGK